MDPLNQTLPSSIRVVFARNPPDVFSDCPRFPPLDPTISCPFPGWCAEILRMVMASAGLRVEEVVAKNAVGSLDWGTRQKDGRWTGVLGYLANGTADTACLFYQRTDLREEFFDLSYLVTNVQPVYVVKRRGDNIGSMLWNAFRPYQLPVWMCILGSFLALLAVMVFIARVEFHMELRKHFKPFEWVWYGTELQFDEKSDEMRFFTISGNMILFIFALLQSAFFKYLYEATLLTSLLQQGDLNPFKDAESMIELIGKGKYHLTTNYIGNWYFDELQNSNNSHFVALRKATAANPVVVTNSVEESLDLVDQGSYIYPIQEDSIAMQMSKQRCNLVYVTKGESLSLEEKSYLLSGLPQRSSHLVFNNNSVFLKMVDKQIIMQQLFIQRTYKKYFQEGFKLGPLPKCDTSQFRSAASSALDIRSAIGIFALFGITILISVFTFFVEIYIFWHYRLNLFRKKAGLPPEEAFNLIEIAKIHFTTDNSDSVALFRLLACQEKTKTPGTSRSQ